MNKKLILIPLFLSSFLFADSKEESTSHLNTIVLGSGCFWGAEKGYESIEGVVDAVSGYADGFGVKPNYRAITKLSNKFNKDNFAEVVKVTFNSNAITLEAILKHFYESHDPTQLNRQGNDIGTQYRSIILYKDSSQKNITEKISNEYGVLLKEAGYGSIKTLIKPLVEFFDAETYHQDYIAKKPKRLLPRSLYRSGL